MGEAGLVGDIWRLLLFVEISQTADAGANAIVDIEVEYRQPDALDAATVCRTHPDDNKYGLGIFVSTLPV